MSPLQTIVATIRGSFRKTESGGQKKRTRQRRGHSANPPDPEVTPSASSDTRGCETASISSLIDETATYMGQALVHPDERVRLRGKDRLDICATPGLVSRSIQTFEQVMRYLEEHGISMEVRAVDGWRICARIGDVAIPIRIRERLHRVQDVDPIGRAIERLLGGNLPLKLVPSGRLELQLMRFGAAVDRFPVNGEFPEPVLRRIEASVRAAAGREAARQRRMVATAARFAADRQSKLRPRRPTLVARIPERGPVTSEIYRRLDQVMSQFLESRKPAAVDGGVTEDSIAQLYQVLRVLDNPDASGHVSSADGPKQVDSRRRCIA